MKNLSKTCGANPQLGSRPNSSLSGWVKSKLVETAAVVVLAIFGFGLSAQAQTATLLATNQNVFVGANFNGLYTNSQLRATLSGTGASAVTVSVAGVPAGATILFSTNAYVNASNPLDITNSWNPIWYSVAVTNVAKGVYPLTFTCSGAASASAVVNLIVGTLWTNTANVGSVDAVQWSTGANWSAGAPGSGDDVIFQNAGGNTNNVDASISINSLTFLPFITGTNQNMTIASGQTVSVVGTNSFTLNSDSYTTLAKVYALNIFGSGGAALVVSNKQGNFSVNSSQGTGGATTGMQLNMTNLDNFSASVKRFGLADWTMVKAGGVAANELATSSGANGVQFAKTNFIAAYYVGDYALTNFEPTFAISLLKEGDAFNNGSQQNINLGMSNVIRAESLAFAQNKAGSGNNIFRFNPVFTNTVLASMPYVSFRNTNGGRINLVAVGVDTGTQGNGSNTRGAMNFNGGIVDMLVETIWLGRNKTAIVATNTGSLCQGILTFSGGTVDVNTCIAGYQAYTNNGAGVQGAITVGGSAATTAVLIVNSNLTLGYYSGDFVGGAQAAIGNGQVTINTNGTVRARQITVGQVPGQLSQNRITLNAGGTLEVTNTVGDSEHRLIQLVNNGFGTNVLHMNGTNTLIYCSNALVAANSKIAIGAPAGPVVLNTAIPVISFLNNNGSGGSYTWSGVAPLGINVVIATTASSVDVTLSTGAPKTLRWVGNVNNTWDTSTKNWSDTATSLSTNFTTGDIVIFDDTASQFNIDVAGDILPSQAGVGIAMTNTMPYTFSTTSAGRILGGASLVKQGNSSLTVDLYSEFSATLSQGSMTITSLGTIGGIASAAGTAFSNGGTVLGAVTSAGTVNNAGIISGSLTAKTSGFVTNAAGGTVSSGFVMESGSLLDNAGTLAGIGSATIVSNALFINEGALYGSIVTVALGGTLVDTAAGFPGQSPGSINVAQLVINGTFKPGGDSISTTKVTDYAYSPNSPQLNPNGRVQLNAGSITVFRFDSANSQPYTKLLSQNQVFGPSQTFKAINGCTLVLTNVGPTAFADGQTFKLFGSYYGDGDIINGGPNTTNSYPTIQPATPGAGLVWDLSQLYLGGTIGVVTAASQQFALTNETFIINGGSNIVSHLSWPSDKVGGWVQQLNTTLTNGLSATNWITPSGGYLTNLSSFTDVYLTNTLVADPTAPGSAVFYRFVHP